MHTQNLWLMACLVSHEFINKNLLKIMHEDQLYIYYMLLCSIFVAVNCYKIKLVVLIQLVNKH